MHIHPDLVRLRGRFAPQPCTDAAIAAWRALPDVAAVMAALARFDAGEGIAALPELARILSDGAAARAFAEGFIAPVSAAQKAEPLAQLPLGHSAGQAMVRLRLTSQGRTGLTLAVFAPRARAIPPSVLFEDCAVHEIFLSGEGRALLHRLDGGRLASAEVICAPGTRFARQGPQEARQIIAVMRPVLLLQLTREALQPAPSREIAFDDARLLKTISGCKTTSQKMMALGVLGALGHRDGLAEMARIALDVAASRDLRWEALRQLLALDAGRGVAVLATLASQPDGELTSPAAALKQ